MISKIRIPENLNFKQLSEKFPYKDLPTEEKSEDYLALFCSVLVNQQLKHRAISEKKGTEVKEDGFVNLCAKYLRSIHNGYHKLIDYLIEAGVIETDNHFIIGEKARGYRFSDPYRNKPYREIQFENLQIKKCYRRLQTHLTKYHTENTRGYNHIIKWYLGYGLEIDAPAATAWVEDYCQKEQNNILSERRNAAEIEKEKMILRDKKTVMIDFIEMVQNKSYNTNEFTICDYGRLHGFFTYRKSELRNFVTFKGEKLVSIDIKNSQPYFSSILLNKNFWQSKKVNRETMQLWEIAPGIYRELRSYGIIQDIITLLTSRETLAQSYSSTIHFRNLVSSGEIYEYLLDKFQANASDSFKDQWRERISSRDAVKVELLRIMYSNVYKHSQPYYEPCTIFNRLFPLVEKVFYLAKEEDYTRLAKILQRLESHLILKVICKKIDKENPNVPLFTIHDSIVTSEQHAEFVKTIIHDVLTDKIGVAPTLKVEQWDQSELRKPNSFDTVQQSVILHPTLKTEYLWSSVANTSSNFGKYGFTSY